MRTIINIIYKLTMLYILHVIDLPMLPSYVSNLFNIYQ